MPLQALTANRLRDGQVVYLCEDDSWSERLQDSILADSDEMAKTLLALAARAVENDVIVDPYLFAVRVEDGKIHALSRREIIRAAGPSVREDLGYQAAVE